MELHKVRTGQIPTWCPGCFNFQILAGVQRYFEEQLAGGKKKEDFAIVTGIGCHAKLFDYINMPGVNTLHGRVPPTALGIKLAKPNLTVFGFSGDGDAYSEGLEHLVSAARFNIGFKYIIHNNQVFALTLGEPTPVTEEGFKDSSNPAEVKVKPLNPIKLMLASGATFVARVFADFNQVHEVMKEAANHRGFAFIEVIQPCLIFHNDAGYKERFYNLQQEGHNKNDYWAALGKAEEFDYESKSARIPLGIFFQTEEKAAFEEIKLRKKE